MNRRFFAKKLAGVTAALGLGGAAKADAVDPPSFPTAPIELIPIDAWVGTESEGKLDDIGGVTFFHKIRLPNGSIETMETCHRMHHVVSNGRDYVVNLGSFLKKFH